MDFDFTEEQLMVRDTARDFAVRELDPIAAKLDAEATYPADKVKQLAEMGFLGLAIPEEHGGGGMDYVSYVLAMEEISRACAGTGVIMSVNNSLVCDPLVKYCTPEQKKKYLEPLAAGRKLGCFGLTEPGAGSDVSGMKTNAVLQGDTWVLNGEKNFITNAPNSQTAIIFAYTDKAKKHKGISAFIVPMDAKGVSCGPKEHKLGICASHSSSIFMDDVRLPKDALLGQLGEGFKIAMTTLDAGRIGIASQALGIARAALEEAIAFAKERQAFGGPIANLQAIQFKLADMATRLDAARLLTLHAAWLKDSGQKFSKESSMAKVFAAEAASFVADESLQIHGGYGYTKEYAAERHFRDARITEIYEGTSEIQRVVIAASLIRD
ncbi:MAG: acyl-CoA dehydrogenase [Deltaproteobacteria bacterium]|nr:acyl-CoA dehydrogenase [Deltaproteobacteria bacterium]